MEKKTTSRFRQFINLPIELVQNRTLIGNLAKNDFKTRFAGSYLGVIWADCHSCCVLVCVYRGIAPG